MDEEYEQKNLWKTSLVQYSESESDSCDEEKDEEKMDAVEEEEEEEKDEEDEAEETEEEEEEGEEGNMYTNPFFSDGGSDAELEANPFFEREPTLLNAQEYEENLEVTDMMEELSCDASSVDKKEEAKPSQAQAKLDITAFIQQSKDDLERVANNEWSSYKKPSTPYEHLANILGNISPQSYPKFHNNILYCQVCPDRAKNPEALPSCAIKRRWLARIPDGSSRSSPPVKFWMSSPMHWHVHLSLKPLSKHL